MLWQFNELGLLFAILAGLLVATESGFQLGLRNARQTNDLAKAHFSALQSAILGLLALLLGFTFFMAVSRFDERRSLVLEESNAIGTTFLRSQLLPPEQRAEARELLRVHVAARLAFRAAGSDPERLDQANKASELSERQLWALARDATARDPHSIPTGLFVESLNGMIDAHEKRRVALEHHVPGAILYLLLVVSLASFGFLGYSCGLTGRRAFPSNTLFALLIVFVLTMIFDIDQPRRGFITIPQDTLIRLQASLEHDAP